MALNSYLILEVEGNRIDGSVMIAGHEQKIEVYSVYHDVSSPVATSTGLPTGKRMHGPLSIVKAIDLASAPMLGMWVQNKVSSKFALEFYRPVGTGEEQLYWAVELENARIIGIRTEMLNNKYPENMKHQAYERVTFAYSQITWTYVDGGLVASDNVSDQTA